MVNECETIKPRELENIKVVADFFDEDFEPVCKEYLINFPPTAPVKEKPDKKTGGKLVSVYIIHTINGYDVLYITTRGDYIESYKDLASVADALKARGYDERTINYMWDFFTIEEESDTGSASYDLRVYGGIEEMLGEGEQEQQQQRKQQQQQQQSLFWWW
jgi:hypothetical protein